MEPALEIKMVRDNLALAVSLWTAADRGDITSANLALDHQGATSLGVSGPVVRQTREELLRRVNNQVRSSFVFSVIQTHLTLDRVYTKGPLEEADPDLRAARCAIHLLNASMGQGLLTPVWICPPEYRSRFESRTISFVLDATGLDGNPVVWDDFGGLEKFLGLLDYCAAWVKTWSGPSGAPSDVETSEVRGFGAGATPARADPVPGGFAPRVPPGPDPVASFVRNLCQVTAEARCPAKQLYQAYRDWCWETGRQTMAQRSFGMGLTRMGFQRRRRGQGYHWWMGISLAPKS